MAVDEYVEDVGEEGGFGDGVWVICGIIGGVASAILMCGMNRYVFLKK